MDEPQPARMGGGARTFYGCLRRDSPTDGVGIKIIYPQNRKLPNLTARLGRSILSLGSSKNFRIAIRHFSVFALYIIYTIGRPSWRSFLYPSAGWTMHTARQCTTDLMLAQARVFPTGGKYHSLLGDFSSRTPLDSLPRPSATAEHEHLFFFCFCQYDEPPLAGLFIVTLHASS